jgi:transglutaminase-like putative cysteine protease
MRLRIAHSILLRYEPPAMGVIQVLRLTPRNHEGQYVIGWRIDVSADARLSGHEDAFGNLSHVFAADGPLEALSIKVDGEVDTQNTDGVVRGSVERFPPSLFLRDTSLTQADGAIRDFAQDTRTANGGGILDELHGLMHRLHDETTGESDRIRAATAAYPGALCCRLFLQQRQRRAEQRSRLGGSLRGRSRVGRFRLDQLRLPDRRIRSRRRWA